LGGLATQGFLLQARLNLLTAFPLLGLEPLLLRDMISHIEIIIFVIEVFCLAGV
jgi:hypothetical protein